MTKHNACNERIKHNYFGFLKEAKRHSEPTVDGAAKALDRFEIYSRHRDFKHFTLSRRLGSRTTWRNRRANNPGRN